MRLVFIVLFFLALPFLAADELPTEQGVISNGTEVVAAVAVGPSSADRLTAEQERSVARVVELMRSREVYWLKAPAQQAVRSEESPEAALPVLAEMARSGDPEARLRAIEGLGQSPRPECLDVVVAALNDPVPEVRDRAARTLVLFEADGVFERVMSMLCTDWPESKTVLEPVLPVLKDLLETKMLDVLESPEESPLRKTAAAYCLGSMCSTVATALLSECAWLPDAALAVTSAQALAAVADPASVPYLTQLSQHPLWDVRWAALDGLAAVGTPEAIGVLGAMAADTLEESRPLQRRAVALLKKSPYQAATPALIEAMRKNLYIRRDAAEALRQRTGMDFGEIPSDWADWYLGEPPPLVGIPPPPPLEEAIIPPRIEIELPEEDPGLR